MKLLPIMIALLLCAVVAQADDCVTCWVDSTAKIGCAKRWGQHCGHRVDRQWSDSTWGLSLLEWPGVSLEKVDSTGTSFSLTINTGDDQAWPVLYRCFTCELRKRKPVFFIRYCRRCQGINEAEVAK